MKNACCSLMGLCLLVSISINAQDTINGDFQSRPFAQSLFNSALEAGIDTSESVSWIFEFSHSDSIILATVLGYFAEQQKELKVGDITVGTVKDNTPRRKLEGMYVLEFIGYFQLDEEGLQRKILMYQKIFKKSGIELIGVGFMISEDASESTNFDLHSRRELVNTPHLGQLLQLIDKLSGKPVAYANIGIVGKEIGTVSNIEGKFSLTIPQTNILDTIRVSCVGYETIEIPVKVFQKTGEFYLSPKARILNEVAIQAKSMSKIITLGIKKVSGNNLGFVQGKGAGAEVARLMKYSRKNPLYLNEVSIYVENTTEQSFQLLVNIYTQDSITGLPRRNLLKQTVLIESDIMEGWLDVNLNDEQIKVNYPFFVSFQWIDGNTKNPFIALKGNSGYQRAISMGKWIKSNGFSWAIKAKGATLE